MFSYQFGLSQPTEEFYASVWEQDLPADLRECAMILSPPCGWAATQCMIIDMYHRTYSCTVVT